MVLKELFQNLAKEMLTIGGIFENIPIAGVYVREDTPLYDPVTGVVTPNSTRYAVTGVKDKPSARSIDNVNVYATDEWLYVAAQTLTHAGLTVPSKPNDHIELPDGSWNVVRIQGDPADAVLIIQLRKP